MANTYTAYTGNGSTTTYAIPVSDWISDSHIIVQLDADGTRYDVDTTGAYSFSISGSEIVFDVAPALDVKFIVMRDTLGKDYSDTALDYDFTDGSVVTGDQLDGVYRHALYLAQEAADLAFRKAALTDNSVLAYDSSSTPAQWEAVPLGLVYDSTNDTFGFGGTSSSDYKFRFNGDTIIREDGTSNGAVLTIENTDVTNQQATLIVSASTPQVQFKDLNGDTDKKFFLQNYQNGVYQLVAQTDAGSAKSIIPLRLQEDGKTVLGGTSSQNADASYQHTMYGDVVIYDDTGTEATLTVQSTHSSGPDAATLRLIADSPTVSLYDDNGATDEKTMQIGFGTGSLDFAFYPDAGGAAYAVPLQLTTDGSAGGVILNALPTTDPSVSGQLWNRNGAVVLSGSSRYIYDSGWITELTSGGTPVSLAANAIGYETLTATQNAYYPFNVTIWGRDASFPDDVYNLGASAVAQGNVTDTVGVHVRYDTSSRDLTLFLQDYAGYHEASSGLASQLPWGTIDEIRITIT